MITEQWIHGCLVERIMFRDGLVLNLDDYNEVVIAVPFRLTLPAIGSEPEETVSIDPHRTGPELRPLFDFSGAACTAATTDDHGELHLEFSSGHRIDVGPDDHRTAWELYGKRHGFAACLPRGEVRVVRHDLSGAGG